MLLEDAISKINEQHRGTEHLAINNTFFRRVGTLLMLKAAAIFLNRKGAVVPLSKHFIVKTGPFVHLAEALTMKFVAENTSLPVPKVYCSFVYKDRAYIIMKRIQGRTIASAWRQLSEESRTKVIGQLKLMLNELRAVKPANPTSVQSYAGGSLRDCRIAHCLPRMGPFETTQEFHLWLRKGLQPSETDHQVNQDWLDIDDMVKRQDGPWSSTVLTHGDLNPFNILIRGETIVGIIDWECSGWYPEYWEYTSAWLGNQTRTEWQGELDKFLDVYPEDLEMERTRQKWWGEI